MGAAPGKAYSVSPWEENARHLPPVRAGRVSQRPSAASRRRSSGYPDGAGLIYNLACAEARLGEHDAALEHLARAIELSDQFAEYARGDDDLASIRDDPRFPA